MKVDASLNQAANAGNLFDKVSIVQQFIPYSNDIYLPLDYRLTAASDYVGIIKIEYKLNSILGDYLINSDSIKNYDPGAVLTILPESGKQDSLLAADEGTVPLTHEEEAAYNKIIRNRSSHEGLFYEAARIFSPQYRISNHFSINGPLSVYQFNHVEGHTIGLSGTGYELFNNTTDARISVSHGFPIDALKKALTLKFIQMRIEV